MSVDRLDSDAEFIAMRVLYEALEPLDDGARSRVLKYVSDRLEITVGGGPSLRAQANEELEADGFKQNDHLAATPKFNNFAELFDAAQPKSNSEKALVSGYWLQVCQNGENFDAQSANKELKHMGHGVANITTAIESLKNQKPALALQLKKAAKSQQARKLYMITTAGVKAVGDMIGG